MASVWQLDGYHLLSTLSKRTVRAKQRVRQNRIVSGIDEDHRHPNILQIVHSAALPIVIRDRGEAEDPFHVQLVQREQRFAAEDGVHIQIVSLHHLIGQQHVAMAIDQHLGRPAQEVLVQKLWQPPPPFALGAKRLLGIQRRAD